MTDSFDIDPHAPSSSASSRAVLWWHGGWALVVILAAIGLFFGLGGLKPAVFSALAAEVFPALLALALGPDERPKARAALLVVWAALSCLACILTGGVAGPLAVWCLAPVAAAAVLGRSSLMAQAAALSLMAGGVAVVAGVAGIVGAQPEGLLEAWLGFLALTTTGVGLAIGLLLNRAKEVRRDLARAETLADLAALLADQPHLIAVLEPDGRALAAFGTAPLGIDTSALSTTGLTGAARADDQALVVAALAEAGRHGSGRVEFVPANGHGRIVAEFTRRSGGRLVCVLRDDGPAWSREAALEAARSDAKSLATGKSRFLANMSHELRTPLNAIMGFSDIMRAKMFGELPGRYSEYADLIHEAGAHLLDLINDVLDMSKIEAQRYELIREALDAREPVSGALRILRLQADEAGVQLRGVLPPTPLEVDADRRALKQIVLNLVSNALKFTPRGGSVTVTLQARAGDMELVVADTGVGIAEEDVARLGRPYEQVGEAEKRTQGTGLGLSLVRAFAELHGGQMAIESRLGAGTAVSVRLPVLLQMPPAAIGGNVVAFTPQR
ncbi:cell cycle sensor histidine kinase DivJ [soil metagenome]